MTLAEYILEKKVEGTLLERLQKLSDRGTTSVETLVSALSPSANTLRELLGLAGEIGSRDGLSLEQVLEAPEIAAELKREGKSRKEKQKNVRIVLEQLRYPHKRELQTMLDQTVKQVWEASGLRFELPEEFEGDAVRITVSAKSVEDLQALSEKFKQAADQAAAASLFAILRGEY